MPGRLDSRASRRTGRRTRRQRLASTGLRKAAVSRKQATPPRGDRERPRSGHGGRSEKLTAICSTLSGQGYRTGAVEAGVRFAQSYTQQPEPVPERLSRWQCPSRDLHADMTRDPLEQLQPSAAPLGLPDASRTATHPLRQLGLGRPGCPASCDKAWAKAGRRVILWHCVQVFRVKAARNHSFHAMSRAGPVYALECNTKNSRIATLCLLPNELQRLRRLSLGLHASLHDMVRVVEKVLAEHGQRPLQRCGKHH